MEIFTSCHNYTCSNGVYRISYSGRAGQFNWSFKSLLIIHFLPPYNMLSVWRLATVSLAPFEKMASWETSNTSLLAQVNWEVSQRKMSWRRKISRKVGSVALLLLRSTDQKTQDPKQSTTSFQGCYSGKPLGGRVGDSTLWIILSGSVYIP